MVEGTGHDQKAMVLWPAKSNWVWLTITVWTFLSITNLLYADPYPVLFCLKVTVREKQLSLWVRLLRMCFPRRSHWGCYTKINICQKRMINKVYLKIGYHNIMILNVSKWTYTKSGGCSLVHCDFFPISFSVSEPCLISSPWQNLYWPVNVFED